ncbi:MAG: peptidylprolyl isomerase [Candidatus Zixiibacteriota bacterium]|nr:MAG: peptidylprolyl isomerase [candidate division Zixibacteria bacterium]
MKKILFIFGLALLLVFAIGCSKEDESAETGDDTEMAQTGPMTREDSLAAIRYPVRDENNKFVTMVTDYGNMTFELYRDVAPAHADSFVARTQEGFYDNTTFFRIIDDFMIQGGDPTGTGKGKVSYYLRAELSELPHQEGTLAMARSSDLNSASTQFYICLARNALTSSLDGSYTIFGHLIEGYDALDKIGSVEVVPNPKRVNRQTGEAEPSMPVDTVYLRTVYVSDAEGEEIL